MSHVNLYLTEDEFDLISGALYAQEQAASEQGHLPYMLLVQALGANIEAQWVNAHEGVAR